MGQIIETERLILRTWQESDFEPMCAINQDSRVMEYFPRLQDKEVTRTLIQNINAHYEQYGFTLYAVELKKSAEFIGFIGLFTIDFDVAFAPAVEIGWRLAAKHWGQGYAPEGAKAVLDYAFNVLKLNEVVSMTAESNLKSRRVMEKIGMHWDPADDFDHPKVANGPLKHHVLYRISQTN